VSLFHSPLEFYSFAYSIHVSFKSFSGKILLHSLFFLRRCDSVRNCDKNMLFVCHQSEVLYYLHSSPSKHLGI